MDVNKNIDEQKFARRAAIAKALSHSMRLQIIEFLHAKGLSCVCELVEAFGCKQPIMSKHLTILKNAGLVNVKKEGLKVFYSLKTPCILDFFECADRAFENHKNSL
ncbi:MAG: helix-turn-helix transcriptional regulator [Candidatus Riflebacteria bacterium]|nr:helix-turn-helix transcriptional regulator [Candidatus Riflebacteria bacterium]